ncbi:hypothetical protein K2X33_06175 [bacterium]|nr:hypothetical protein [bacterium]
MKHLYLLGALTAVTGMGALALYFSRGGESTLTAFTSAPAPTEFVRPLPVKSCDKAYEGLIRDGTLKIVVVFGYKDARPSRFVGDRYERAVFASYLTARCQEGWEACGFTRSVEDPDLYERVLHGTRVSLRLTHSSAGPDDDENRHDSYQAWLSKHAERTFFEGLREADIVFYNGHSRDGGGPDFRPPQLTADKHVDYAWYIRERPQMKRLFDALESSGNHVGLFGLFSCSSSTHFLEELSNLKPDLALITSNRLLYYSDALSTLLGAVSATLQKQCAEGWGKALALPDGERPMAVRRFFE